MREKSQPTHGGRDQNPETSSRIRCDESNKLGQNACHLLSDTKQPILEPDWTTTPSVWHRMQGGLRSYEPGQALNCETC